METEISTVLNSLSNTDILIGFLVFLSLSFLFIVILWLLRDRSKILKRLEALEAEHIKEKEKEKEYLRNLIDVHHRNNLKLSESLFEVKNVLSAVQNNRT